MVDYLILIREETLPLHLSSNLQGILSLLRLWNDLIFEVIALFQREKGPPGGFLLRIVNLSSHYLTTQLEFQHYSRHTVWWIGCINDNSVQEVDILCKSFREESLLIQPGLGCMSRGRRRRCRKLYSGRCLFLLKGPWWSVRLLAWSWSCSHDCRDFK